MSADRDFCVAQLQRISKLRGAPDPSDTAGVAYAREVLAALIAAAATNEQAQSFIDEIMRTRLWFPAPAEIYAMAIEPEPAQWQPKATYACQRCLDSGWESFERIVNGLPNPYARRCNCKPIPAGSVRDGKMAGTGNA